MRARALLRNQALHNLAASKFVIRKATLKISQRKKQPQIHVSLAVGRVMNIATLGDQSVYQVQTEKSGGKNEKTKQ